MLEKTEGIVIRTVAYGESHLILTVFTKERGKLALMARGAKKTKSPFAAVAQLFSYGQFQFHYRSSMSTLSQGEVIEPFRQVREDIEKTAFAAYICELLDGVTIEREASPSLFTLVLTLLRFFDKGEEDPEVLLRMFELKMTYPAGIKPELDRCARCRKTEGDFSFSVNEAGFLCEQCSVFDAHRFSLEPKHVRLLRQLYYLDPERLGHIYVKAETKALLQEILQAYYDTYSGLYLKSKHFLDQWQNWKPKGS
ncbi:DNA repair protein RecO (recombination protein O) [Geomicrobium halophilum]|uniref:DNA repair protein RecO n=1 Tax=Geomicrobium halophilum TaxID=549000 RepID=A0A841PJ79_9BACL|nr:DNA repair protein RecO [Geomicrobium halophilum]MBB6448840.1 DNA repair protein RecO (recombination protein O) [Geomicrobium halophilum]